jgi:hypothetical protein
MWWNDQLLQQSLNALLALRLLLLLPLVDASQVAKFPIGDGLVFPLSLSIT